VATDRVVAGTTVGEMAVLTNQPRAATVVAGPQGAAAVVIPGAQFRNLLLIQPDVGVNMLAVLAERLRQNEMRRRNAELATRVHDLARDITVAENMMRAKSDFLAAISHELRTPLNGIIGLTDLVLDSSLTPTQRDYLTLVRDSGDALLMLINDLLDLSKIEAGQMRLEEAPFALRDQLGGALKTLAVRAHRKGLELGMRVRPDVPDSLVGDSLRLRQVLVNLVGNAIKFTDQGEVRVDVEIVERRADGVTLQFAVRDTGIGIPKERLTTIFQPYAQADASIARRFGGTGLGLSICLKLVAQMQGELRVESVLGQGSTFLFTAQLKPGPASDSATRDLRGRLSGKSALVIDSHASTRATVGEMLQDLGLAVRLSADGAAEQQAAASSPPGGGPPHELVVVEARLADSFAIVDAFRRHGVPQVLMLRTSDETAAGSRCDELNIPHALKPIKFSDLSETIAAHLEQTSAAAPEDRPSSTTAVAAAESMGHYRILLADDSLVNQKVARAALERMGHTVIVAANGREALGAVAAHDFHVVLMDVLMPDMDGLEATAAIREREKQTGGHLPIIAMTAHSADEEGARCLAAGMDAFVSKPVQPKKLVEIIDSLARRASAGSPAYPPFDWMPALANVEGNRSLLKQTLALIQAELPRLLREIRLAVQNCQGPPLRLAVRALQGLLKPLNPQQVLDLAHQLECLGAKNDLTQAAPLVEQLELAADQLRGSLSGASP
jgi:signal transduction histidine kinase/CheY-like chemotaxis protein